MDDNQVVNQVVQKQATVGDIISDYVSGLGPQQISEKWGVPNERVVEVIKKADEQGKFMPEGGSEQAMIDKVSETPASVTSPTPPPATEPLVEGDAEATADAAAPKMASTKNTKA